MTSERRLKIYLSHVSEDIPVVRELYQRLMADGFLPWMDAMDLEPGENWELAMDRAMLESDVIIACLSRASVVKEGYIQSEYKKIEKLLLEKPNGVVFLIPLRLEESDIPALFRPYMWLNYFEKSGYDKLIQSLKRRAEQLGLIVNPQDTLETLRRDARELRKARDDSSKSVRVSDLKELGEKKDPQTISILLESLKDQNSNVRQAAAEALGLIGSEQAIPFLREALNDNYETVRNAATEALNRIANGSRQQDAQSASDQNAVSQSVDSGENQPQPNIPDHSPTESQSIQPPTESPEVISQYRIQDNALEKHAATDKPIQNIEQDKLGFDVYVTALHDFIVSQYTTTPLTISVDGPWGSGKSSLMYMLKNSLDPQDNIWRRFISGLITAFRWWSWFLLWFISLPVQMLGRALVWIALKFDKVTGEFDFRIGQNSTAFRSLITDIAQGLSTNPEVLQQRDNNLSSRAHWWARVHARCQAMDPTSHPTIWLNAWKFDNEEQVWASLALATLEQIKQKHNIFWMAWFRIRLTFRRLSPVSAFGVVLLQFVFPILLGLIAFYYTTIVDSFDTPLSAFDAITDGYAIYLLWIGGILSGILTVSSLFKDPFQIPVDKVLKGPNYKDKVGFLTRFEEDFARIIHLVTNNGFGWKKSKLIIFVDDLDRCEPPKAADIVEAINLFLDADGCVFVIGMDSDSVAKSIEVKYKDLFDRIKAENAGVVSLGRAFLDKIVQIPFTVPRATPSQILNMVEDTLGGKISKGITIAKAKEKPLVGVPENDQGVAKRDDQSPAQHESAPQPETTTDEKPDAKLDPASFARKEVRQAIHLGTELLSENPRQVKTFVNLFRLSIYIANARGFFEEGRKGEKLRLIGLDRLAIWVACSVRWQNLVRHLYAETQMNSLCIFLHDVSKGITTEYKWTTGNKNIPAELKKKIDNLRKGEKSSEAHWCHLPWEWWLLEPDFLQVVKRMEDLWASPTEGEVDQLKVLLNMSRPLSPTSSTKAT